MTVALDDVPAVVLPARAERRLIVDFFETILADVADVQVTVQAVETIPPRVAQTVSPDLVRARRGAGKRIRRRNAVRRSAVDVDAQVLAEEAQNTAPTVPYVYGLERISQR